MHEERKPQKVIFFLSIEDSYDIYADCRNIYESDFSLEKDAHFIPINISRSVMANMGEIGLSYLKDQFINKVLRNIDSNWDRNRDSFYFCGYRLGALALLDAVIDLRNDINIEKVSLISPPLHGYDVLRERKDRKRYRYEDPRGPLTLLLTSRGKKVQTESLFRDMLPKSDYLTRLRSYLSSLGGDNDPKVYIASASVKKLCDGGNIPDSIEEEIESMFTVIAKELRTAYDTGYAPDLAVIQPLADYLSNANRQQFYAFISYMYNGQDHDGFYSMKTQEVPKINNENIVKTKFSGYSGGGHIALLDFLRADFPYLFNTEDNTLANPHLQRSILMYFLLDSNPSEYFQSSKEDAYDEKEDCIIS